MNDRLKNLLLSVAAAATALSASAHAEQTPVDTVVHVDRIQVTAIKQGLDLRSSPVASTVLGSRTLGRTRTSALKEVSELVPNFFVPDYGSRMTSSIYVRGLGARIDQPAMGMNVDNVPLMNKNNYDFELVDAERIEVLRGPQSTLYGRNTMGGVVNVYTLSPLAWQGTRFGAEYGSGRTMRLRASTYHKLRDGLGIAAAAWYVRSDGFFDNLATGERCDWERLGGGRLKIQWRGKRGLRIENTAAFSSLTQGGYPYAYAGDPIADQNGQTLVRPGEIRYNDPSSYDRTNFSDGFTLRYDAGRFSLSSITSYQYSDDRMILDQDFLPLSYFTLRQTLREHTFTEDLVLRSRGDRAYRWLFGAFGFYKHGRMEAPVLFKRDGIDRLILANANAHDPEYDYAWRDETLPLDSRFRMPDAGAALYHESEFRTGGWHFTAGIRVDWERAVLHYENSTTARYTKTRRADGAAYDLEFLLDEGGRLEQSFTEVLPEFSVRYAFDAGNDLYLSAAKGYKAGGFNTQMFSDVLQQKMMKRMGFGTEYDIDRVVSYKPERSWNYELGGRFTAARGALRGDFALFWIECRDQQLTVFPEGTTTGRMMTNAGRTRSLGAELSVQASPWRRLDLDLAYGYTHAVFRRFDDGRHDFRSKRIPYAPEHTASLRASWSIPTGLKWLGDLVLTAGARGAGRIWWDEENTLMQPFYVLLDATIRIEHDRYSLDLWGRNLAGERYDTFRFVSMGNAFLQRGRPRTFGITLNINISHKTDKP